LLPPEPPGSGLATFFHVLPSRAWIRKDNKGMLLEERINS
jgi:hypothetical protein